MTTMKKIANEFSLVGCVNRALDTPREKREITSWHASGFGSCPTGRYLERLGVEPDEPFDQRTLRVFSAGTKFEEWMIELALKGLPDAQISLTQQVRVEIGDWGVSGYADAVVDVSGERIVYEIKSKHSRAFHWMEKMGEGAMRQHQMQVWLYLHGLGIEEGRILYVSKDDLCMLEYPVYHSDGELSAEVANEVSLLNRAWEAKLPPRPIEDPKAWQNKYCRFHKQCLAQEKYLS